MNAKRNGMGRGRWIGCLFATAIVVGCGSSGPGPENRPPTVELTSGPVEGETVSYSITIAWEGTDPDGVVSRYEYAVDPPTAFTEEEIASGGPGVVSQVIPGTGSEPDVTRISKVVGGEAVSFDWVHTTDTSHHFIFRTAQAESLGSAPTGRFTGMHAVYVRAVDNDEAISTPDHVAFTAETVAPEATITRPDIALDILTTGLRVAVEWTGTDPDGPAPVGYLYRSMKVESILGIPSPDLLFNGEWTYEAADSPGVYLNLDTSGVYLFGIRAVDDAGAEEPFLDYGRNAFRFVAWSGADHPLVVLSSLGGSYAYRGNAGTVTIDVPPNRDLECKVTCSAGEYGETCVDMRWGLDVADLEDDPAWSAWSTDFTLGPIEFPVAGIHVLYVQVRDSLGNLTKATLIMNVVAFSLDKEVLWVDDSFDDIYPRDSEHDAFWRARFDAYPGFGAGDVSEFHSFLDNDRGSIHPQDLGLSEMGRYRLIVWETRGTGFDGQTALVHAVAKSTLGLYLSTGGKLWLGGRLSAGATDPDPTGIRAALSYPKEFHPGDFAWDYMKLHTSQLNDDRGESCNISDCRNNLLLVHPFPGRTETYPELTVDPVKQSAGLRGRGIIDAEAVLAPILDHAESGFSGILDSLYVYGATGNEILGKASPYHNRLVAVRWHDPDPSREQGRIQWFGFALYYFNDAEAQETFNRSLDWFREETPPTGL